MSTQTASIVSPPSGITPIDSDFQPNERAQEERDRQADCPELTTFLKRTTDAVMAKDREAWERIINEQVRSLAYYDNRQYGAARNGIFIDAKWEQGDVRPIDNRYLVQVNKLLMEMMRSHPTVEVGAADPNDALKVEAAKFAQHRVNEARKRLLKHSERERENMSLLLKTITYRYIRFNPKPKYGPKERRARKEARQYGQTRTIRACGLCGHPTKPNPATAGETEDQYQCIHCGSNKAKEITLSPKTHEVVTGYDEVTGGCVESRHIDPMMVRIDLDARRGVSDSLFLWYHQLVNRCILEENYKHVRIKAGSGIDHVADRYKHDLQTNPSHTPLETVGAEPDYDTQGGDQLEKCPYDLIWLDPPMYRGKKFTKPQRLLGGRVIPANVDIGQFFPEGMCVARNADQILDVYGEDKNQLWLFCVYGIREHALHGTGTTNLLGPQDTRNEIKAYLIANLMYNASPREFIRDGAITGNRLPGLNEVAVINNVASTEPVENWGYQRVPGAPMPEQAMTLYDSESGAMQEGAGTASLSSEGTDSEALSTAFGVATMRDQAVGRMGPNLMLTSEMEEEWSYLVLEHELNHFSNERFMKMANQAVTAAETDGSITFSVDGIKAFMESNPRVDFNIRTVPESWTPRNPAEKKANMAAFSQFVAVIAEKLQHLPGLAQRLIAKAAEVYDVDIEVGGWNPTALYAMARIRLLAKTVEIMRKHNIQQPTDENVQAVILYTPEAAIDNEMDNHILFREYYEQWWASDEGRSCPPLLRAAVRVQHYLHGQGLVAQARQKAEDELAANEPRERKAAEIAAAAQAQGDKPPAESLSYKDAPPSIRRQMERAAGYEPAMEDDGGAAAETAKEAAKVEGQLVVQQQKTELEKDKATHQAQLDVDKMAAEAQLDEERAESDHDREMELEQQQEQHERGMEGAKMAHESADKAADRAHEATQKDADRKVQKQSKEKSK